MKKIVAAIAIAASAVFLASSAVADTTAPASQPLLLPSAPQLNAKAYILMDINSGTILAEKNANTLRPPASLTKLMTLFLTERALAQGVINADDKVRISKMAWQTGGSRMFLKVGSEVPVHTLAEGMITVSGNDAAMALAQYVGGSVSTFVQMMNQEAKALGMTNTHFDDPTGLPAPTHKSTAMDLAKLTRAIWIDFPQYHDWYDQKWFTFNGIRQPNRNRLLWRLPGTLGLKTGHTDAAGYCLISIAQRDGMTLLAVVLGTPTDNDRSEESISLLNYGFRFFNTHLLYQAGSTISKARVWYGDEKYVPVGSMHDVYVTAARGQYQNVKVNVQLNADIQAPIQKNQILGQLVAELNGQPIATYPLIALNADAKGGWFRSASDGVSHKVSGWFGSKAKTVSAAPAPLATSTPPGQVQPGSTQATTAAKNDQSANNQTSVPQQKTAA